MDDTRLPKCVMFGEMVGGAGCVGVQEKEWMGCFLDDLRAFGINADQWTTAAQDKGEWRRTAERGAGRFMAKWIVGEKVKAGLRHAVVCPNVTGRTKERIAQSKRARVDTPILVDYLVATSGVNLYPPGGWCADAMTSFSGVTFVLFCFVFVFILCIKAAALRSIVLRYAGAPIATRVSLFFPIAYLEILLFSSILFYTISAFSLDGEYVVRSFLPNGVFLPRGYGLDF